jgi:hypothetical protein
MDLPIICDLTPDALHARREELLTVLAKRAVGRAETPEGYVFTFHPSSDTLSALAAVIDAERQCCRWLRFAVVVEPDGGPITLTLSGPGGAREFLSSLFGPLCGPKRESGSVRPQSGPGRPQRGKRGQEPAKGLHAAIKGASPLAG